MHAGADARKLFRDEAPARRRLHRRFHFAAGVASKPRLQPLPRRRLDATALQLSRLGAERLEGDLLSIASRRRSAM
jgi:hypothetical protein